MSSFLDVWQCSEFASNFDTNKNLQYFFRLLYKKKKKLFVFYFCWELKFVSICNISNIFYFSKNRYFEFHFLASQGLFIHPPISDHVTLRVGKIDMWLTTKMLRFVRGLKFKTSKVCKIFPYYFGIPKPELFYQQI